MTDRLITHLRHVDLAVPDFDKQREFYTILWCLTPVAEDDGIVFLAAEGSADQRRPGGGGVGRRAGVVQRLHHFSW